MAGEAIFVGYRRDDTADVAGRVYDAMVRRFGKGRIFKDVDNIGPGVDFGDYIRDVLPRCRVALILIGPNWLDSKDEAGSRRLDNEHDWVRVEVETALAIPGLLVVPVLVNGARMPRGEEVPETMRALTRKNAANIRRDPDFHDDVERLSTAIKASVGSGIIDLGKIGARPSSAEPRHAPRKSGGNALMMLGAGLAVGAALFAITMFAINRAPPITQADAEKVEPPPTNATEQQAPPTATSPVTQADAEAWSSLRTSNSPSALSAFIRDYPSSQFASAARARLASLDEAAWQTARGEEESDATEARLNEYLRDFPRGAHAAQAREWLTVPAARVHVSGGTRRNCAASGPHDHMIVYFEWERSGLNQAALEVIDEFVGLAPPAAHVEVVGHDDTSGLASFSMGISERRASVVRDALVARGMDPNFISTWGAGELELAVQTRDGVREPLNRRTSLKICR